MQILARAGKSEQNPTRFPARCAHCQPNLCPPQAIDNHGTIDAALSKLLWGTPTPRSKDLVLPIYFKVFSRGFPQKMKSC